MKKIVLDIFYPPRCPVCDDILSNRNSMSDKSIGTCKDCDNKIEYVREPFCLRCGKPLEQEDEYCSHCAGKKDDISGRAVFVYNFAMQASMAAFKYKGRQEYKTFYADEMAKHLKEWILHVRPDAFLPVPIHPDKRKRRGYNQAELIAERLGKIFDIPVLTKYLIRNKKTIPQKELGVRQREMNLRDAFLIQDNRKVLYQFLNCVIIVDDIYTTGSTIKACSEVLKKAGVNKVYFVSVCIGKA